MLNEFQAVGMLINDLRKGRRIETDGIIEEIEDAFREITLQLGHAWINKVQWLDYLLDFHWAEAERLMVFVEAEAGREYVEMRACLHQELKTLAERIDVMINGSKEVDLSDLQNIIG